MNIEKCIYQGDNQVNDWCAKLARLIENLCKTRLGFRPSNINSGHVIEKAVNQKPNMAAFNGSGGSKNYQWLDESTLTVNMTGLICKVIVPRELFDQITVGSNIRRIEYRVSWSGNRVEAWLVP